MSSQKATNSRETWVTCRKCKEEINLSSLNATLHRENWYHLNCWKSLVGKL